LNISAGVAGRLDRRAGVLTPVHASGAWVACNNFFTAVTFQALPKHRYRVLVVIE